MTTFSSPTNQDWRASYVRALRVRRRVGHNEMEKTKEKGASRGGGGGRGRGKKEGCCLSCPPVFVAYVVCMRISCCKSMHDSSPSIFLVAGQPKEISAVSPPRRKKIIHDGFVLSCASRFRRKWFRNTPAGPLLRPTSPRGRNEENRFLDFPLLLLWPFDIFVAVDRFPKGRPTLAACACDVNSYDGCASDVRYTIHVPHVP